jgi:hypothetical protein
MLCLSPPGSALPLGFIACHRERSVSGVGRVRRKRRFAVLRDRKYIGGPETPAVRKYPGLQTQVFAMQTPPLTYQVFRRISLAATSPHPTSNHRARREHQHGHEGQCCYVHKSSHTILLRSFESKQGGLAAAFSSAAPYRAFLVLDVGGGRSIHHYSLCGTGEVRQPKPYKEALDEQREHT